MPTNMVHEVFMRQDGRVERKDRLCDVCQRDKPNDRSNLFICRDCAHPKRVRVYYQCCGLRLDLSLQEARNLFSKAGMDIWRTGVVLRFIECPHCVQDELSAPNMLITLHVPDSELEFYSVAYA